MNSKTKLKGNLLTDVYVNISVAATWNDISDNTNVFVTMNGFVEVSQTRRKFALIVFDRDLYKKYILIGASEVDMDLPNGTSIYHS